MRHLIVILFLLVANPLLAQDEQQRRRPDSDAAFADVFSIQNVEFSEQQAAKIKQLREEYVPKLTALNRQRNALISRDARKAMLQASAATRKAGKSSQEARLAGFEAARLTAEQQQVLSALQQQHTETVQAIRQQVRELLTKDQVAASQRGRGRDGQDRERPQRTGPRRVITPTHADVKYGPHDRNVMDVWLADSLEPTPVLVSIHGGGFRGGNKSVDEGLLRECLDSKISVVAITYRLSDEAIAPAQFLDSARAVQYIRHNAKQWNIDPTRLAATGGSAGAGISLWLGFHDDLADPNNDDPVLRESTRLKCMAVYNGQTSYDPRFIRELFPNTDTYRHSALSQLFNIDFSELDNLPEEKYQLFREVSALPHASNDDVPTLLMYASQLDTKISNPSIGIHHPRFGTKLQEKMDALGIECSVETGVRRGNPAYAETVSGFIKRHLGVKDAK